MQIIYYDNPPMQNTADFNDYKNDNFQLQVFNYFLIFALKHRLWVLVRTVSLRRF